MEAWLSRYSGDEVSTDVGRREMEEEWCGGVREAMER
jgi:hypothetical protein